MLTWTLPTAGKAGDGKNSPLAVKVGVACVEVPLSDQIKFGIDALTGGGNRNRSVQELVKDLSTMEGARVVLSGFTSVKNGSEATFAVGQRSHRSGEVEHVSVLPVIQPNGRVTVSVAQRSKRITGYKHTRRGVRRHLKRKPIISTQSLESSVTVRQGTTIVLGGLLITERDGRRFERLILVDAQG